MCSEGAFWIPVGGNLVRVGSDEYTAELERRLFGSAADSDDQIAELRQELAMRKVN